MARSAPRRPIPLSWPVAGAALGVVILAVRLTTAPLDQTSLPLAATALGLLTVVVVLTARAVARRNRLRAVTRAEPGRLVIPLVGGVDTSAATRWLAEKLGDPRLALRPQGPAYAVADGAGLRLTDGTTTSAPLPAGMLSVLPLTTVAAGMRRVDALAIGVAVGDVVAPLPLLPARAGVFAAGALTDAELLDVSGRLRDALAGTPDTGGWQY